VVMCSTVGYGVGATLSADGGSATGPLLRRVEHFTIQADAVLYGGRHQNSPDIFRLKQVCRKRSCSNLEIGPPSDVCSSPPTAKRSTLSRVRRKASGAGRVAYLHIAPEGQNVLPRFNRRCSIV